MLSSILSRAAIGLLPDGDSRDMPEVDEIEAFGGLQVEEVILPVALLTPREAR